MSDAIDKLLEGKIHPIQLYQMGGHTYQSKEAAAKALLDYKLRAGILSALKKHSAFEGSGIYPSQFENVADKIVRDMSLRLALRQVFIEDMDLDPILADRHEQAVDQQAAATGLDLQQVQTEAEVPAEPEVKPEDAKIPEAEPSAQGNTVFSPTLHNIDAGAEGAAADPADTGEAGDKPGIDRDETPDDIPDDVKAPTAKRTGGTRASTRRSSAKT